jgi:hypothetical protein
LIGFCGCGSAPWCGQPYLDDDSDTYTQQVHQKLMADQTVNGYALDLTPDRTDFALFEADIPLAIISQDFLVRYRTSRTLLTSA